MVMNIGAFKSGELAYVTREIETVLAAIAPVQLKVILETAYLTRNEIVAASRTAADAGAAFIKSGTGFGPRGATVGEIRLIRRSVPPRVRIKAAGGIRNVDEMLAMLAAGAVRIGTSRTAAIAAEWHARNDDRSAPDPTNS
jgi:deoxyribose-phosphate aldolase